jgi:hypothetical protein
MANKKIEIFFPKTKTKIEIFFPNTKTENPIWEYANVTGYITTEPISMEDFIKKNKLTDGGFKNVTGYITTTPISMEDFIKNNKLDYASGFSDQHGKLKDGRYEETVTSGGRKSKKRRPKRISKKSCKRRK